VADDFGVDSRPFRCIHSCLLSPALSLILDDQ